MENTSNEVMFFRKRSGFAWVLTSWVRWFLICWFWTSWRATVTDPPNFIYLQVECFSDNNWLSNYKYRLITCIALHYNSGSRESQWEHLLSKALEQRMDALICGKRFAASTLILHVDGVIGARHGTHRPCSPWKLREEWGKKNQHLHAVIQSWGCREMQHVKCNTLEDSEYLWTCAELPCHHFLLSIQVWSSQDLLKKLLLFISGGEHQVLLIHAC